LDETHWEIVRRIDDITQHLNHATDELRKIASERKGRTGELRYITNEIDERVRHLRAMRRSIQAGVGRDVCPKCGSTEIATISYGYPSDEQEEGLFETDSVNGGCCVEPDETVCCTDCGTHFLGNLEKWQRARMASSEPETVLEVGAEGGALSVVRQRDKLGNWEYWCLRDETTLLGVLQGDDVANRDDLVEHSAKVAAFEDALLRLDQYPWFRLFPLKTHPDFASAILREVETRGGKDAARTWTERLGSIDRPPEEDCDEGSIGSMGSE
jgi:hypothetical protein